MFCDKCGAQISPDSTFCPSCGAHLASPGNVDQIPPAPHSSCPPPPIRQIPNHLVGAILATFFCCLPFGIVSIVYASSVNSKLAAGDVMGAQQAADKAQTWLWIAFGVGLAVNLLIVLMNIILIALES